MNIIDCKQGDKEWFRYRLGSVGGSSIASVMAKGQGKMRKNLLYRLAGEILSEQPYEGYSNKYMEAGLAFEDEARDVYSAVTGNEVQKVGLVIMSTRKHFSPDGLIKNGIIEIKYQIPSVHIETIIQDEIPSAYRKQCQWGLSICKTEKVDFISYCPSITDKPIWIIQRGRNEKLIKEMHDECDRFLLELSTLVRRTKEA